MVEGVRGVVGFGAMGAWGCYCVRLWVRLRQLGLGLKKVKAVSLIAYDDICWN